MSQWKLSADGLSASRLMDNGYTEVRHILHLSPEELAAALPADPPTQQEQFSAIERSFDQHIDAVAEARGYGRIGVRPSASCIGFAGFPNQWQAEAIKFAQWSSTCCALMIQGQHDVIAGARAMPTPAAAIAELPPMVW